MTQKAVHAVIEGRVQAVGFRYWTAREAEALSLRGWVRNRRDGTVEALFAGPEEAVDAILDACRRGYVHEAAACPDGNRLATFDDPGCRDHGRG